MGISIKNDEVEALARKLASKHGKGLTEIVHDALREKAEREARLAQALRTNLRRRKAAPAAAAKPEAPAETDDSPPE